VLLSSFQLRAQVGNPRLIGRNNLTGNRAIGSNNNWGLAFKTNNTERGRIENNGNWAVGTNSAAGYKFRIRHGTTGIDLQSSALDHWEFYISSGFLNLYFNDTSNFRGSFDPNSGVYSPASDERLKTNIKPMTSMLEKINQLKPSTYEFKNALNKQEYTGLIAQDVLKVFPSLVSHVTGDRGDYYSLNYSGLGVIAIKGIQELQQTINAQQQKITILEDRITKLESALAGNTLGGRVTINASLQQNQPNPFSQATTIRYTIPQGASAQISIYDGATGALVKTMRAPESGQVQINAFELRAGTYTYTLLVNGNVAASKQMVILK